VDLGGRSGQVQQISPLLGFDLWTVQPVTDCAVPAHSSNENFLVVCMLIYMLMNIGGNNDDTSFLWATSQNLFGTMETYAGGCETQVASKDTNDCLVIFEVFVIKRQFVETIVIKQTFMQNTL